jgi:carboxypeptidase Taq
MKSYLELEKIFKKIGNVNGALAILDWDSAVIMPPGSEPVRAEQVSVLSLIAHELLTHPKNLDLLNQAEQESKLLDPWQVANLREMRRSFEHETILPEDLVEKLVKANSTCEMVWRSARPANDFKKLAPYLTENLNLARHVAALKSEKFKCTPYDALVDEFDPQLTSAKIDEVFGKLELFLPSFINQVIEQQKAKPEPLEMIGPFSIPPQKALGLAVMKVMDFDFSRGRLDVSTHPFSGGVPGDLRITTRYSEGNFITALMGVIHETGHALYESNLPAQYLEQPVGRARGMAIHESQSLLMEMQVGCSREFLSFVQPLICQNLNLSGEAYSVDNIYSTLNQVQRSLIRVDADEVTYPAHVMLRYRLERQMIERKLEVKDLPEAWREGMKQLIGISPSDDKDGCMQDIHWHAGDFGYFPSYTFGAINAAQIFSAVKKQLPDTLAEISQGNFKPLNDWLREHIHSQGSLHSTRDLLVAATGSDTRVDIYIDYLTTKYLP